MANRSSHASSGPTHTGLLRLGSLSGLFMSSWWVEPLLEPGSSSCPEDPGPLYLRVALSPGAVDTMRARPALGSSGSIC